MANNQLAVRQSLQRSSLSIRKIGESLSSFTQAIRKSASSSTKLVKISNNNIVFKNKLISNDKKYFAMRREAINRKNREDIIEAGTAAGSIKRSGKVRTSSTKGFLGRILDFFGILFIGWAIKTLPQIIKGANTLMKNMTNLYTRMRDWKEGVFQSFSNLHRTLFRMEKRFKAQGDFSEQEKELSGELETSQDQFGKMDLDSNSIFDIFDPIRLGFGNIAEWAWRGQPDPNPPPEGDWDGPSIDPDQKNTGGLVARDYKKINDGLVKSQKAFAVDNIPTMLTIGEYVVSRPVVNDLGVDFFDALNSMLYHPSLRNLDVTKDIKEKTGGGFSQEFVDNLSKSFNKLKQELDGIDFEPEVTVDLNIPDNSEVIDIKEEVQSIISPKLKTTIDNLQQFVNTKKSKNTILFPINSSDTSGNVSLPDLNEGIEIIQNGKQNIMKILQELNLS
tara:strand:- start:4118 stop:5458 length:1341 start_codon:yes stop_codon:yes gene_type:complete